MGRDRSFSQKVNNNGGEGSLRGGSKKKQSKREKRL
jgi:hypothetical protein